MLTQKNAHTPRLAGSGWISICLAITLFAAGSAWADDDRHEGRTVGKSFELTPFASYFFEGDVGTDYDFGFSLRDANVQEGGGAGLLAAFRVNRHWQIELMYSQLDTQLEFRRSIFFGPDALTEVDVDMEFFQAGVAYTWTAGQIEPFVDLTFGTTEISPKSSGVSDTSNFSVGFGGGVKVFVGEHLGFRFQGRILSTDLDDNDFYCDERDANGFPVCYFYDDDSYLVQPELSVGLILAF